MLNFLKRNFVVIILITVFLAFRYSGLQQLISLENLLDNKDQLLISVQNHYWLVLLSYLLLFFLAVALSLPSYLIFTLAAGFLFDIFWGTIFVLAASLLGTLVVFLYSKLYLADRIKNRYERKLRRLNLELETHGSHYLIIMRFISFFPFWLFNLLAGVVNIPLGPYAWSTVLGMLPATLIYTFMGSQIADADTPEEVFSWQILAAFFLLKIIVILITLLLRHKKKQKQSASAQERF
ncbi:MAG: TVP38/TMEM64 family protein [Candidatus Cloacimonadales bacterium]